MKNRLSAVVVIWLWPRHQMLMTTHVRSGVSLEKYLKVCQLVMKQRIFTQRGSLFNSQLSYPFFQTSTSLIHQMSDYLLYDTSNVLFCSFLIYIHILLFSFLLSFERLGPGALWASLLLTLQPVMDSILLYLFCAFSDCFQMWGALP